MTGSGERPLTGRTVLVTRPKDQADGLCGLIEAAGGRVVRLPLLEIVPVHDGGAADQLLAKDWHWLIFVSANAVRFTLARGDGPRRFAPGTRIAAVGEATARALEGAGIRVDLIPKPQFNSESLLADPAMARVAGQRILIVRGVGGREHLSETLRKRGAETAYAELYRRAAPDPEAARPVVERWRRGGIDGLAVTSGEALGHLMELLGPGGAETAARTPLAVIGSRIATLAREHGWRRVAVAERADDEGLLAAMIRAYADAGP